MQKSASNDSNAPESQEVHLTIFDGFRNALTRMTYVCYFFDVSAMPVRNSQRPTPARILLVDDNVNGLSARKCVLDELGHKTTTAASGAEALEVFDLHKFDLVVTDYKMARMNGIELIAALREQAPDLPIILISGFVDALGLSESNTGADVVIQKSANEVSHLVRSVGRLLRRAPSRKGAGSQAAKAKRKAV
jgi:CheY-like chemotaxis protein